MKRVKVWVLITLSGLGTLLYATRTIPTDTQPYFLVRDSFKTEDGYYIVLQPATPVQFVAQVNHLDELPLNGEGQQCKIVRQAEKVGEVTVNKLHMICKKWEGDINTVVFPPR